MSLRQSKIFEKIPGVSTQIMRGDFKDPEDAIFPHHTWLKITLFNLISFNWEATILLPYNPTWSIGHGEIVNVREIAEEEIWYNSQ